MANELQNLPEASKLMGSFQKAPKGYIGPKEIAPALQEIDVKAAEAQKQLGESDIRIEKAKREEAAATGELKKAFYEKEKAAELEMPERAAAKSAREDLAAAKFEPTKDTVQDIAGLFSLMGVVGMVIGKKNAVQGMYAMNGAMEGHIKGRKDLFTRQAAEFDKQFKILQAKVESTTKELEEARKLRIYDQKAGEEAIAIAVARSESPLIKEMTARLGIEKTINVLNQTKETVSKMAGLQNDLQKAADDREFKKQQLNLQRQKLTSKIDDVGAELREMGVNISDKKDRAVVQEVVGSMAELKDLHREVRNNPNLVGRQGQIAQFTDRYIKSFKGGESVDESKVSQADQEALLFAKKYASMLTRYERALAGSSRAGSTVSFQNRYNSLLSQNQFNPASMSKLFDDMQIEAARGAMEKSNKLTYSMLDDMSNRFNTRLYEPAPSAAAPAASSARQNAPQSALDYLKKHPEVKEQFKAKYGYLPEGV